MLYRGLKLTVVGTGLVLAAGAFAEGQSPKVGFEYRAGVTYDDGNLVKVKGGDAETKTNISLEYADLVVEGEASKGVTYKFDYNVLASSLAIGLIDLKVNDMINVFVGRDGAMQGGWNVKENCGTYWDIEGTAACAYAGPLTSPKDSVGVTLALAGTLKIAVANDEKSDGVDDNNDGDYEDAGESAPTNGIKNNSDKSQAVAIEWAGNFGGWMPLVQIVNYDLGKSMSISAGVKGMVAGLGLMLNYTTDSRKNYASDKTDTYSMIDVHVGYTLAGFTPWVSFHQYDVKQGGTNGKTNSALGVFDDNAQAISVGVNCNALGDTYVPYLSINSQSGKYTAADTKESSDKTKSGLLVRAGVLGKF